jgi:large subunit ribosomal protein L15
VVINLAVIEAAFANGDTVSPQTLVAKKIVSPKKGKVSAIKVLGNGDLTKKITLSGCVYSASVKEKVEKAGGSVI